MECGQNFWGLLESFASYATFADPDGPWYVDSASMVLDWRKANTSMAEATGTLIGKIAAIDLNRAMVSDELMSEFETLTHWNATREFPFPATAQFPVLLAAEVQAAKQLCCLYSTANEELKTLSAIDALPDQPSGSKPGAGIGLAQGAGIGLGILLILWLWKD